MKSFLGERLTYDKLFRMSTPERVTRSLKVRGPPLELDSYQDALYYAFNFKSYPSTTGLRHRGYIKFIKPRGRNKPLQHLDCVVDCECPDYKYRWAWANKQRGSSRVGPQSLNQALNRAPRRTNPRGRPGLCKHILAAREYIYGMISSFPGDEPDTAEKLNKLTRHAQRRWINFPAQMRAAKEREAELRRRAALRNVVGPVLPTPTEVPTERPVSTLDRIEAPEPETSTEPLTTLQPEPLPEPETTAPPKPKGKPGRRPRALPHGAYAMLDGGSDDDFKNFVMECVVTANGDSMSTNLKQAIELVEEMEADELASAPEPETLEPSEPPVSDSAVGADTEGDTALSLLRQMRDFLAQLATALAPEETPEDVEAEEEEEEGLLPEEGEGEGEGAEGEEDEFPNHQPVGD